MKNGAIERIEAIIKEEPVKLPKESYNGRCPDCQGLEPLVGFCERCNGTGIS